MKKKRGKHQQLIGWFMKNYVKENIVDKRFGQFVHKAYDNRSQADYEDYIEFDEKEVAKMMDELSLFIGKIEELIRQGNSQE